MRLIMHRKKDMSGEENMVLSHIQASGNEGTPATSVFYFSKLSLTKASQASGQNTSKQKRSFTRQSSTAASSLLFRSS